MRNFKLLQQKCYSSITINRNARPRAITRGYTPLQKIDLIINILQIIVLIKNEPVRGTSFVSVETWTNLVPKMVSFKTFVDDPYLIENLSLVITKITVCPKWCDSHQFLGTVITIAVGIWESKFLGVLIDKNNNAIVHKLQEKEKKLG